MKPIQDTMTVTRATATDLDTLVALTHDFYAESGHALDADWAQGAFARLIDNAALGAVWIARMAGVPAGHAVLTTCYTMEHGALGGNIDDLFVKPEYRRLGVAGALLEALLAECRNRQCRSIRVEVGGDNAAACALYARYGLQATQDGRVLMSGPVPAVR